jgi:ATP-binding cassette subfamily B protein
LGGGLTGLVAISQLVIAAVVLAFGADMSLIAVLLFGWTAILCAFSWRYFQQRQQWTDERLKITNDLVERMAGHRTRLAQQPREQWHLAEDAAIDKYIEVCCKMDRTALLLTVVIPRGWMILSFAAILPGFVLGGTTPTRLAVGLGGILLAQGALRSVTATLAYLSSAAIAWRKVKPLFQAASTKEPANSMGASLTSTDQGEPGHEGQLLIDVRDVVFHHRGRADNVLNSCKMQIFERDRILLEGVSGTGKSTFAALLSGLRQPHSGLITFRGLDRQTLGANTWRRLIAAVPQYHENHLFSGTLAFNLLMGRRWPPQPEDYEEADSVCRELGLGDLLDRMPAGLMQMVGEAGWQLSMGERSRVFLARALLQRADFIIVDESLGALDPETMQNAIDCIYRRAQTLLVIAHP